MHWFGFRVVELDGTNPGKKCLEGPFDSYSSAKVNKESNRARDMEQTRVFTADSEEIATSVMDKEQFSRL